MLARTTAAEIQVLFYSMNRSKVSFAQFAYFLFHSHIIISYYIYSSWRIWTKAQLTPLQDAEPPSVAETPLMVGSFHQVLTNLCGSAAAYCVATYAWTSAVIQTSNLDMACL